MKNILSNIFKMYDKFKTLLINYFNYILSDEISETLKEEIILNVLQIVKQLNKFRCTELDIKYGTKCLIKSTTIIDNFRQNNPRVNESNIKEIVLESINMAQYTKIPNKEFNKKVVLLLR